jgi:tRNA modification GTPase
VNAGTAFSVLTPSGRGAVAVIGVAGSQATSVVNQFFVARNGRPLDEQPLSKLIYGHWGSEDLIVFRRDESSLEVQCHGGSQSVSAIVTDLVAAGSREIPWQEWVAGGNETSISTEAQIALAEAASFRTAEILLDQWHGALERELDAIGEQLQNGEQSTAEKRLAKLLSTAEFGQHLTRPWRVVIAGRPNVGKSSLINALVGYERAIVFDQPGTTRDVVTASTVIDGWPISLSDTAGLHGSEDEIEKAGMKLARERLATADLVLWMLDATQIDEPNALASGDGVINVESGIPEASAFGSALTLPAKQLLVLNKIDRVNAVEFAGVIATSAVTGTGIDELLTAISNQLVPMVPAKGDAVLFTERQKVAVTDALWSCRQGDVRGAAETVSNLLHCVKCGD